MKTTLSILQKVLVNHFYTLNAGLFVFLSFVLFGLPYDVAAFHMGIAIMIVQNQPFLFVVFAVWFLYDLKCIDYTAKQLIAPQQQFLTCLQNTGRRKCFWYLSFVQFAVYLPVTAYAVFLVIVAFQHKLYIAIAEIFGFTLLMLFATSFLYVKVLERRFKEPGFNLTGSSLRIPKTLSTIPLMFIWSNRKQMLLITKFFSLLFLFIFIKTFEPDHYDIRPLLFCFLLSAVSNCTIVFEIRNFENDYLSICRNFPYPISGRFLQTAIMYTLLLLPELAFVWKAYPLHFHLTDYLQLMILGVALLLLLHASLLTGNVIMDTFIKIAFGIVISLFFIILYNPGILLPLLMLAISFGLFYSYYYDFEK